MSVNPLTPEELHSKIQHSIPDEMIMAVNQVLESKTAAGGRSIRIAEYEITRRFREISGKKYRGKDPRVEGWLNIEPIFEAAGWEITRYGENLNESLRFIFERPCTPQSE